MGPENEGKPNTMGSRIVDVRQDALEEVESLLMKTLVQMDEAWNTELIPRTNMGSDECRETEDATREAVRGPTTTQVNMKLTVEVALLKLRNLMVRPRRCEEDPNNISNLKRSRASGPLDVPRLPEIPGMGGDAKLDGAGDLPNVGDLRSHVAPYDIMNPTAVGGDMLPLKFIRTGDNTKAPFQKPSTIFSPSSKLVGGLEASSAPGEPVPNDAHSAVGGILKPTPSGSMSPKKRPSRSRRDRNRSRDKVAAMPEPIMQTLQPGDQNKIPEDGYLWRKYGNKNIKTASYKRGYYKCRHFKEMRCLATKIVQQTNNDPSTFSVSYKGVHTCPQQGNQGGVSSSGGTAAGGSDSSASLADQVNEAINRPDSKTVDTGKDVDKDDSLENMDWPAGENSSDSASDDMFGSSEIGEEVVDSGRIPEVASPHFDFVDMSTMPILPNMPSLPTMPNLPTMASLPTMPSLPSLPVTPLPTTEIVEPNGAWNETSVIGGDFKKYQGPETLCPDDCQDISPDDLVSYNDNDQLLMLKLINNGSYGWDDQPSDISFWYNDMARMGMSVEPFSFGNPDNDLQL